MRGIMPLTLKMLPTIPMRRKPRGGNIAGCGKIPIPSRRGIFVDVKSFLCFCFWA